MPSGLVSNIQRYSLDDGPGIRTTVFLKGCPLACLWCHNPENRSSQSEIAVAANRCLRCGQCAAACPRGHAASWPMADAEASSCQLCGRCVDACPTGARQMVGRRLTVEQLMAEIRKDTIFFGESGGGVTFSGGEPLAQPEFLRAMLDACAACGIETAVDTCGFAPPDCLLDAAAVADLFLYDLKSLDDTRHTRLTGVSNRLILDNLKALSRVHPNIWLRVPVVPGLNDSEEDLLAIAHLAASLDGVRQVNLLPYHATASHKYQRLGKAYELNGVAPPTPERMQAVLNCFTSWGLTAKVGG